jgi:hypothetical protein
MLRLCLLILLLSPLPVLAEDLKTVDKFTHEMHHEAGHVDFYWDEKQGKIYLALDQLDQDLLYIWYLQSGVGSNDLGLDRGQIGGQALVRFTRLGNKILLIEPNQSFRAESDNPAERQAVEDGFAQSVLWGGVVVAESEGVVLVDWTDFLLRDSQGIAQRLTQLQEGSFSVDAARSAIVKANTVNFPLNTEFEALITLQGSQPGKHVRSVSPAGDVISVRTHHSLVRLPEQVMTPRVFDPRSGGIPISFKDYAAPLGQSMDHQWVIRHRLEKSNPELAVSDPTEPIIYYLDPGTPEPVRSALLDGARWWSEAFTEAGFSNAFEVRLLPNGADPLDIRYNTIQWVHRSTRGWSYGASIVDPRSGEILKGHVTLGSLRVRQDMLIAQSLLSPFKTDQDTTAVEQAIKDMALARLRQLSAHEVGHTLGLIHNFHASSLNRASVMDYPHPLITITEAGELDLSDAYDTGIGEWDKVSLAYLYQSFAPAEEKTQLEQLLHNARASGQAFIADRDARMPGGSHPMAHLWDNGRDAAQGLLDVLQVRQKALQNFGLNTIKAGQPVASLERHLVPVYLFHRYQTEAAVKLIGGVDYRYAMKGEDQVAARLVEAGQQHQAIQAVLQTLQVEHLALPKQLLPLLLPPVEGSYRDREHFKHRTGLNFDALGVAETAAGHSLSLLLHPQRINRITEHHARDARQPELNALLEQLWEATWEQDHDDRYHQAVQHGINWTTLQQLLSLAGDQQLAPLSRAEVQVFLNDKHKWLLRKRNKQAIYQLAVQAIERFKDASTEKAEYQQPAIPPGSPIGG